MRTRNIWPMVKRVRQWEPFRQQAEKRLRILDAARSLADLAALNSNRLEGLKGNRKDQYSIRIKDQWGGVSSGLGSARTVFTSFCREAERHSRHGLTPQPVFSECPADFWMNLQGAYELDLARQQIGKAIQRIPTRRETLSEARL